MDVPSQAQYADLLSKLSGIEFQEEIAALHVKNGIAFQSIPTKPAGDGGLDGTSHCQTVGYCCYGLELAALVGKSAAKIAAAVVEKFKEDLRKLLELKMDGKSLAHCPNKALASIMAPGVRLSKIVLVCNWFENHAVLGLLNKAFAEYKAASQGRFVAVDCELLLVGPKQLASTYTVDDVLLARLEKKGLMKILESPSAAKPPQDVSSFDEKFQRLADAYPKEAAAVKALRDDFMRLWCEHMKKMEDLNNALPTVHGQVHRVVAGAAMSANLKSLAASAESANTLVQELVNSTTKELASILPEEHATSFATGVVASLIGDCPLRWRA